MQTRASNEAGSDLGSWISPAEAIIQMENKYEGKCPPSINSCILPEGVFAILQEAESGPASSH